MLAVLIRTIKDRKISFAIYTVASVLFVWMYVGLYPTVQEQAQNLEGLTEALPEAMMESLGIAPEDFGFNSVEQFLGLEKYSFIWPILVIFMLIGFAAWAIAGDIERGSIELPLSKPISRLQLFAGRYVAGALMLVAFTLCTTYAPILFSELHSVEYVAKAYHYLFAASLLFGWGIYSVAMMASAFFSEKSKTFMTVGGLLLLMYVAQIVSVLVDKLENVKYLSFFYYFDHTAALLDYTVSWQAVIVFTGVAVTTTALGAYWFNRRDITI